MSRNRKQQYKGYQNILQDKWFTHYMNYLTALTYQLFEWENLPDSVDPRYLEMSLHQFGFVGFYKDPRIGMIAIQGAASGTVDHYLLPTKFHAVAPNYQNTFNVYNYGDLKNDKMGVIIWNNDAHCSTIGSLELFAAELANIRMVTQININAQRTPILVTGNDNTKLSMQQVYIQYDGNAPVIYMHESIDPNTIKVHKTDAPFVADKLNTQRNAIWNEVMTFMGIQNANLEKKERMIISEAESNNEQIDGSANIYLKSREEACERINQLYGTNISVKLRQETVEELMHNVTRETSMNGGDENVL